MNNLRKKHCCALIFVTVSVCSSCTTVQGNFSLLENHQPIFEQAKSVDIYRDELPTRKYIEQARLDAHFEKTYFVGTSFDEGVEQLKIQALLSGSQAIINIEESQSRVGETRIYHFSAMGIRYVDQ